MRETEAFFHFLDAFIGLLTSPSGLAILVAMLGLVVAAVTIPGTRWVFLTAAIYFSTLPVIDVRENYRPLAFPLEQFRASARPMVYFFASLLLFQLLRTDRGWRRMLLGWPLVMYFIFEQLVSVRLTVFGGFGRGLIGSFTYVLLLLTLGVATSRFLKTIEDLHKLIWSLSSVGALVVFGTCYQLLIDRTSIVSNNRLIGMTSNPQFLGLMISFTLPFACYLLTKPGVRAWVRPFLVAQITLTVVFLIWTGSRTGALATSSALLVAFHRRLGRTAVVGGLIFGAVLLVMPYFEGSADIANRLIWTGNTRAGVLSSMIANVQKNFWFGSAGEMFGSQESSYLEILGQFGIFGALPFIAAAILLVIQVIQLRQMRRYLGTEAPIVDVICGVWAAVFIAGAMESVLLGVITFTVLLVYVFAVLTTFLLDWCRASAEAEAYEYPPDAMLAAA